MMAIWQLRRQYDNYDGSGDANMTIMMPMPIWQSQSWWQWQLSWQWWLLHLPRCHCNLPRFHWRSHHILIITSKVVVMLIIVPFKCEKNNNCLNSLMMIRLWWYLCNYVDINYHLYDAYKDGISPSYIEPCPLAPYPGDDMLCYVTKILHSHLFHKYKVSQCHDAT